MIEISKKITFRNDDMELRDSFNYLKKDQYAPHARRYRRFSQFKVYFDDKWVFELLPHRPLIQSKSINTASGGIAREFEPMDTDPSKVMGDIFEKLCIDKSRAWHLDINQYRVYGSKSEQGVSVPEGRHRDGHQFVQIIVFERKDITGSVLSLYNTLSEEKPRFSDVILPGEAILINDEQVFHDATPVLGTKEIDGYRDYFSTALNYWENRNYGEKFERDALSYG
ncbi:2OG-Fe dioxygenase family protein [Aliivibrio fischeri]|uniref:2OG-Fe dioxygenase family protein n=1 Tax=Aliivibrio fischeri TaxID=668 RepID=UPI001F438BFA|nr:2OG-Fe dioxygenase family protein [Aliivibrio fischeri]MCE7578150.1 2OG-Fe dioxygenase family protein [Aliivibrio fischeri]MCE7590537.1 2OG-Fe dioxygenase family protein [Aliivibrio fischeri]